MRLVIDGRLLDHSGIGVYLSNVLPGVLPRCAALEPALLVQPDHLARARVLAGASAEVRPWAAAPLTFAEMWPPPIAAAGDLWWVPHFNVPLASNFPLVATLYDLLHLNDASNLWTLHKRLAIRAWLRAIRRRARHVICVSEFARQEAIRLGRLDSGKISVVPLGVDPGWAAVARPRAVGTPPYLLFVGLVKPHKNLSGLLRAFEMIAPMIPHRLILVGRHIGIRGVDEDALTHARRLAPRVELLESVSRTQLANLVSGADLLVQPSFHEGFGLPPLEAMAAGTPVLAARAGAMPEVCGEAAVYCDPGSTADIAHKIIEVLSDDDLRARMRSLGLARARLFTWDACARATAEILLAACANPAAERKAS